MRLTSTIHREILTLAAVLVGTSLSAAEPPPAVAIAYKDAIQPLLKARCVRCHGPNEPEGGLDLSRAATILEGGESGAALAESVEESLLWQRVTAGEMPPDRPLSPAEQDDRPPASARPSTPTCRRPSWPGS